MELRVADRIVLMNLIAPVEGDVTKLRLVRALQGRLGFTEQELEALNFSQEGSRLSWKEDPDAPAVEIEITPKEQKLIATEFQKANALGKLTLQHLPLYEKFCPDEEN